MGGGGGGGGGGAQVADQSESTLSFEWSMATDSNSKPKREIWKNTVRERRSYQIVFVTVTKDLRRQRDTIVISNAAEELRIWIHPMVARTRGQNWLMKT